MTHEELDALWNKSVNISITAGDGLARYRYAEYVAAAEREACAKIADSQINNTAILLVNPGKSAAAWDIANAIRARGSK